MQGLKGYRTILVAGLAALAALLGKHVAPDQISAWADVIIAGLCILFAGLRLVTNSPAFSRSPKALEIQGVVESVAPGLSFGGALTDLNDALTALRGHPLLQPSALSAITALANVLATTNPAPVTGAQSAAPQPVEPTSDPVPEPSPAPLPNTPRLS